MRILKSLAKSRSHRTGKGRAGQRSARTILRKPAYVLFTVGVAFVLVGSAHAADAEFVHSVELAGQAHADSATDRLLWTAISTLEIMTVAALVAVLGRRLVRATRFQADTWVDPTTQVVCDIDSESTEWTMVAGTDKFKLLPKDLAKWHTGGCDGEVWCFKNNYRVGAFKLVRQPDGKRNRLLLTVCFEARRADGPNSGPDAAITANLQRTE